MILEFRCSNFGSINDEVVFSMQAISGLPKEDTLITLPNHSKKYLRTAQIYGSNGSGKTTLLRAIDSMRSIIVESYKKDYDIKSRYMPHKFNLNEPTTFVMQLIPSQSKDETVYYYTFSYNGECIKEEALYYLKDEEYVTIYERDGQDVTWGDEFTGNYNLNKLTPSMLLLSYVGAVKSEITLIDISQIKEVYNFFKEDIVLFDENLFRNKVIQDKFDTKTQLRNGNECASDIKDFIKKVCEYLDDIQVYDADEEHDEHVDMIYKDSEGKKFTLNLIEESSGVNRLFTYAAAIINCIHEDKVFIFDELERTLHPEAIKYIVQKFNYNTKNHAQAIFATHADISLDQNFVRQDQIWFTNITPVGLQTQICSLSDFKDVSINDNIRDMYLAGRYGGLPDLIVSELKQMNSQTDNDFDEEVNV